ncbi:hypothetical protein C8C83_0226 [Flavobacterium sp. 90]|uniref:hypothetical protein n=1 Tax=unclassified Flavobacterium TaxID=196869 RepID=UPI000EAD6AAD|nr:MULTISPECIES: hypothetical protein [unclassified Flavobacterium]RKR08643.1 hypothetical protein C8C82_0520 [Flavobacterium sp. 81]TCK52432.1 hypothetical protein C8C83_0226 [Flavobacterium sp. 90]
MTETEIKEKILELFKEERQRPDLEFEESHFLDFLTFPAHSKNNIKNSFKGVRKYYRFMNRLELEFSICFTLPDLDKMYSIDKITKKVIERIGKRRGNVMIIKQRINQKENYYIEIFLTALLILTYTFWGINLISIILTLAFGFAIYWILSSKINSKRHNQKLNIKIMNQERDS